MTDLQDLLEQKPITKPPGKWQNWSRMLRDGYVRTVGLAGGRVFRKGELVPGFRLWPSKDAAETAAAAAMLADAGCIIFGANPMAKYLGAFPEGETP